MVKVKIGRASWNVTEEFMECTITPSIFFSAFPWRNKNSNLKRKKCMVNLASAGYELQSEHFFSDFSKMYKYITPYFRLMSESWSPSQQSKLQEPSRHNLIATVSVRSCIQTMYLQEVCRRELADEFQSVSAGWQRKEAMVDKPVTLQTWKDS